MVTMLLDLARLTIRSPRKGIRAILQLNLPLGIAMAGIALVAILSALLLHLSLVLTPPPPGNPLAQLLAASPLQTAVVQGVMLLAMAVLVHGAGRMLQGQGRFVDSVVMVAWLQAFFVALQAVQVVGLVVMPPLAGLVGLMSIGLFFWMLTLFTAEVHGFQSAIKVFLGIIVGLIAVSFVLTFVLVATLGPEAFANV